MVIRDHSISKTSSSPPHLSSRFQLLSMLRIRRQLRRQSRSRWRLSCRRSCMLKSLLCSQSIRRSCRLRFIQRVPGEVPGLFCSLKTQNWSSRRGFKVNVFAEGKFRDPRWTALVQNGEVLVADSRANSVIVLHQTNKDGMADQRFEF